MASRGGAQSTYIDQPPYGPGHLNRIMVPTVQQGIINVGQVSTGIIQMGGAQDQNIVEQPPILDNLEKNLIPTNSRNMTDAEQILVSSQVGRGQSSQVAHPLPTQALPSKTAFDFMTLTLGFMLMTQIIHFAGFYCVNRTTFYTLDCKATEFYPDFIMDKDHGDVQSHYFVRKRIMTQYLTIFCFRTGEFFLHCARERINKRRLNRATEESRFLTAKKKGVWSNREDGLKMNVIKRRMNMRIAGLTMPPVSDCEFMGRWLGRSRQDCFVDSGFMALDDVMPLGAPVIDFLRIDSERPDGWAYPSLALLDGWRSNRGIPKDYPCTLDISECVIGKSSEADWVAFDK